MDLLSGTAAGAASSSDEDNELPESCNYLLCCKMALDWYQGRLDDEPIDTREWLEAKAALFQDEKYCFGPALHYLEQYGGTLEEATDRYYGCLEVAELCRLGGLRFMCDRAFFSGGLFKQGSGEYSLHDFPGILLPKHSGWPQFWRFDLDMPTSDQKWEKLPYLDDILCKQTTHNTEIPPSPRDDPYEELCARQNAEMQRDEELREAAYSGYLSGDDTDEEMTIEQAMQMAD